MNRRKSDRRNQDFLIRYLLVIAVVFALGVLFGVTIEQRNAQNIKENRLVSGRVER